MTFLACQNSILIMLKSDVIFLYLHWKINFCNFYLEMMNGY